MLALAITGMASRDAETVRSAYVAMDLAAWQVLVLLAIASFVSGTVQSLGTRWGLLLHYWVLVKLWLTVIATVVLVLYTETLDALARSARRSNGGVVATELQQPTVVVHAALALLLLVAATGLTVCKPAGLTRRGRRRAIS